jgi:hypothetical protein
MSSEDCKVDYSLFDVVVLVEDIPDEGLRAGMRGVIIEIYSQPVEGYEIEFCDEQGRTVAQLALSSDQFQIDK